MVTADMRAHSPIVKNTLYLPSDISVLLVGNLIFAEFDRKSHFVLGVQKQKEVHFGYF